MILWCASYCLTYWSLVPHICLSLHSGISPVRRQDIIWTIRGLLLIAHWKQISVKGLYSGKYRITADHISSIYVEIQYAECIFWRVYLCVPWNSCSKPVRTHLSYCSLALNHRYVPWNNFASFTFIFWWISRREYFSTNVLISSGMMTSWYGNVYRITGPNLKRT